jgi:hypothetical protein
MASRGRISRLHGIQKGGTYVNYSVWKDGKARPVRAHILVAEAFIGPRPEGMHVCHNDGDGNHNVYPDNIRYDSAQNNEADKIKHGTIRRGERNNMTKHTEEQIMEAKRLLEIHGNGYGVIPLITKLTGVSRDAIGHIKRGTSWKHLEQEQKETDVTDS